MTHERLFNVECILFEATDCDDLLCSLANCYKEGTGIYSRQREAYAGKAYTRILALGGGPAGLWGRHEHESKGVLRSETGRKAQAPGGHETDPVLILGTVEDQGKF